MTHLKGGLPEHVGPLKQAIISWQGSMNQGARVNQSGPWRALIYSVAGPETSRLAKRERGTAVDLGGFLKNACCIFHILLLHSFFLPKDFLNITRKS